MLSKIHRMVKTPYVSALVTFKVWRLVRVSQETLKVHRLWQVVKSDMLLNCVIPHKLPDTKLRPFWLQRRMLHLLENWVLPRGHKLWNTRFLGRQHASVRVDELLDSSLREITDYWWLYRPCLLVVFDRHIVQVLQKKFRVVGQTVVYELLV